MVGYAVEATCDLDDCEEKIDRGLAYVCGGMHDGDEFGCGQYFCPQHLFYTRLWSSTQNEEVFPQLCGSCSAQVEDLDDIEDPGD
jgi:hypothetical protein